MRYFSFLLFFSYAYSIQVKDLTLEQKVGQILMAYFDGEDLNEYGRELINKTHLGSYIYYDLANGKKNPKQMRSFSKDLQKLAKKNKLPPLFICTDQEGGIVSRLKEGFTSFPGNGALGKSEDPNLAYLTGLYQAKELRYAGVNLNLAPVVDVNNNPNNPIIGIRSFSDNPEEVVSFAKQMCKGYKEANLYYSLKHFPGHGDVSKDSHKALPVVNKSIEELEKLELYPFSKLAKNAPSIMTAHILFPKIDPDKPATLSSIILQDILRKKLNYQGIIISDSLRMKGVLPEGVDIADVAIEAFNAGCDILCIGGKFLNDRPTQEKQAKEVIYIFDKLVEAVLSGKISQKRLDESVERILKLKEKTEYFTFDQEPLDKAKAKEVALLTSKKATKIYSDKRYSLGNKKILVFAPSILSKSVINSSISTLGQESTVTFFDISKANIDSNIVLDRYDTILFLSYNAWKSPAQLKLIQSLSEKKQTICIALRDPYELDLLDLDIKGATYSPSSISLEELTQKLKN